MRMRDYKRMSFSEREEISRQLAMGESFRAIGRHLGRSTSTVSRECQRTGGRHGGYRAWVAQEEAFAHAHEPRRFWKLDRNPPDGSVSLMAY